MRDVLALLFRFFAILLVLIVTMTGLVFFVAFAQVQGGNTVSTASALSTTDASTLDPVALLLQALSQTRQAGLLILVVAWFFCALRVLRKVTHYRIKLLLLGVFCAGAAFALSLLPASLVDSKQAGTSGAQFGFHLPQNAILRAPLSTTSSKAAAIETEPELLSTGKNSYMGFIHFIILEYRSNQSISLVTRLDDSLSDAKAVALYNDARFDPKAGLILIPQAGLAIDQTKVIGARAELFRSQQRLADFEQAYQSVQGSWRNSQTNLLQAAVESVLWAWALASIWFFIRLTRWPLFNGLFALGVLGGLLSLPRVVLGPELVFLSQLLPIELAPWLLSAVYLLFGLIFFGVNLFQPKFALWKQELKA